ncbi:diacylglycerol/lipid kinase family protein [Paraurantiacibacter namhicola]|uniref:Putative lipid kinase n=1 Tax=Paraurantiacibacter namhicola TaxID=645517 RepID=A0A1C7D6U9_9SPHN|nr:diacylglycerol kinase family protein [Paraurantiacibacter namhicola]ANU07194.1 Putative lipid kinase [Paraurantiacibacter namhicola]
MKIALVYNERLQPKRMARVQRLAAILQGRGHEVIHAFGDSFDASRDAPGADLAVLAGGDGTARLVIGNQPDIAALPPLAIYPTGTINLLARELGYSRDPEEFARQVERRRDPVTTRIATIGGAPFLACASVGVDAHSVSIVSEKLKLRIGRFAYVAALLALFRNWPRTRMQLVSDHGPLEAEAVFVLRGRHYAGRWTLDRAAQLQGESLRVLALPDARRRDLLALVAYALTGSRKPKGHWHVFETQRLSVHCDAETPVQADGDVVDSSPVEFALTQQSVRFV